MRTVALIAYMVAACDAGEKPARPAPPPGPTIEVKRSESPPLFEHLRGDTDLVMTIDVAALRRSTLWAAYARDVGRLVPGTTGCAYDPLSDATSIVIGFVAQAELQTVVVRGLDRDKTLACPGIANDRLSFADATTLVVHHAQGAAREAMPPPLREDTAFVAAFEAASKRVQPGAAITIVSRPGSKALASKWSQLGTTLQQIYGSIHVTDRLDLRVSLVLGSLTEATNLASAVQSQRQSPQIKQLFDRFDVIAQGSTMNVELGMTGEKLANMITMVRAMLPAE